MCIQNLEVQAGCCISRRYIFKWACVDNLESDRFSELGPVLNSSLDRLCTSKAVGRKICTYLKTMQSDMSNCPVFPKRVVGSKDGRVAVRDICD